MKTNKKLLKKVYMMDDETWVKIKSKKEAKSWLGSKTSCCWGQDEYLETGFYHLAHFSPIHFGNNSTVLYCKTELIKDLL